MHKIRISESLVLPSFDYLGYLAIVTIIGMRNYKNMAGVNVSKGSDVIPGECAKGRVFENISKARRVVGKTAQAACIALAATVGTPSAVLAEEGARDGSEELINVWATKWTPEQPGAAWDMKKLVMDSLYLELGIDENTSPEEAAKIMNALNIRSSFDTKFIVKYILEWNPTDQSTIDYFYAPENESSLQLLNNIFGNLFGFIASEVLQDEDSVRGEERMQKIIKFSLPLTNWIIDGTAEDIDKALALMGRVISTVSRDDYDSLVDDTGRLIVTDSTQTLIDTYQLLREVKREKSRQEWVSILSEEWNDPEVVVQNALKLERMILFLERLEAIAPSSQIEKDLELIRSVRDSLRGG